MDETLFGLLRQRRKELADAAGVPPYTVFSDRTLVEMAGFEGNLSQLQHHTSTIRRLTSHEPVPLLLIGCLFSRPVLDHEVRIVKQRKCTGTPILLLSILFTPIVSAQTVSQAVRIEQYLTGEVDPVVLKVPDEIQNGISRDPVLYSKRLVDFLTAGTQDGFIKVKRIHDWITENIGYDNDHFFGRGKPSNTLKDRRATCGGFATLFKDLVTLAGMEAIAIHGKSRETFDVQKGEMAGHEWNAVTVGHRMYIVDTTHDSRFSFTNGRFGEKSKYRDTNSSSHRKRRSSTTSPTIRSISS